MKGPCRKCGKEIEYKIKGTGSYDRRCRSCQTRDRRDARLKKMGLSAEQHDKDVADAKGCCNVCGKEAPLNRDHCHATGKARGLLCLSCNLILGHAKDDIELLCELVAYLEDYEDIHSTDDD